MNLKKFHYKIVYQTDIKMADTIIEGTNFNANPNTIMYTSPKASAQGAKSVNILNKASKSVLRIATPLMLTWGASDFVDEKTGLGDDKFSMSLQFPADEYSDPEVEAFLESMKGLESKIKNDALTNSKDWFGKVHKSADIIDALWTPMLKYSKDKATGEYNYSKKPTLRVKIPKWEGQWKVEIYDEEGEKLFPVSGSTDTPLDYLKKGSHIACIIQFAGIWFVNGKFSASWKLVQAVVQKPKDQIQGCLIKLKNTDKQKIKSQQVVEEEVHQEDATIVEDSDEEEEYDADEPQPEPQPIVEPSPEPVVEAVPEPVTTKRRVVTKKK